MMTQQNEFQDFFSDSAAYPAIPLDPLFTEAPPPLPPAIEQAHSGYAPMDRIALEGQAYRGLASGGQPWWVIISAWIIFSIAPFSTVALMAADMMLVGFSWAGALFLSAAIALSLLVVWIMYRGTRAKLTHRREQIERRRKYHSEMKSR